MDIAVQLFAYCTIVLALWWVAKQTGEPQSRMLAMVSVGFVAMILVYVVDKTATHVEMLSLDESSSLVTMIGDMMLIIIGYYFGAKHDNRNQCECVKHDEGNE